MPIVNYVREHTRFIEYASEENLSASEMLLWYALMHQMNQRAQGNIWPEEFVRIDNDRLLSYLPFGYDALAEARNKLKQRGIIDYVPGERNKKNPTYKIVYFYPTHVKPQTEEDAYEIPTNHRYPENPDKNAGYPEKTDNLPGKKGFYPEIPVNLPVNSPSNMGGNMGGNMPGNPANNNINYNLYSKRNQNKTHLDDDDEEEEAVRARAREEVRASWTRCYGKEPSPYVVNVLANKGVLLNFEEGVLARAIELAAYKCADSPMDYIGSTLSDWADRHIHTVTDAEKYGYLRDAARRGSEEERTELAQFMGEMSGKAI